MRETDERSVGTVTGPSPGLQDSSQDCELRDLPQFSCQVVGWSMQPYVQVNLVTVARRMA